MKRWFVLMAVLTACALVAGCAPAASPTQAPATSAPAATAAPAATNAPTTAPATPTKAAAATSAPSAKGKICMVTDAGGIDDKAFNATAWQGAQLAGKKLGWDAIFLESRQQTDYDKNINEFINSKCDLIVTVGFLMGDAVKAAAQKNPNQKFQILDVAYDPPLPNVWGQVYAMEQPTFMAGYLAAGMSKNGKAGVFGGLNIPPVADFFIGFEQGIKYYNQQKNGKVQLLGWSNAKLDGLFVGSFTDGDGGRRMAETLMDEGVDVMLPQGGPEGLAAATAMKQRGNVLMIGVDTDQVVSAPENASITLTSAVKHLEISVQLAAQAVSDGTFKGGSHLSTLAEGGVGVTPFHELDSKVPAALKTELDQIKQDIISGKIKIDNFASLKKP